MSKSESGKRRKNARARAAQQVDSRAGARSRLMPWILVAIIVVFTAVVRIRLLGVPLERDEGEYAYAGQLMLNGFPPYKFAFNMKFPGIYAAYAAIMGVFGQTMAGIHIGFMLVNIATIVLIYLLGKRLLTPAAGVAASAAYALLSIGYGVLGTQAHATHFVVLAALGGTLQLLRGIDNRRWPTLLSSGLLYGIAMLMKQHGVLFIAFGASYLIWAHWSQQRDSWRSTARELATFLGGVSAPIVLTGFALWWAGVFDKFWFWTFKYASEYVKETSFSTGLDSFSENFPIAMTPNFAIWLIALVGLALIWWKKEDRIVAVFVSAFLVFSFLAICPGLYFRYHYFVLMLPAIALLAGAAVGTLGKLWARGSWFVFGAYGTLLMLLVVQQRNYLFQVSPLKITRVLYAASPFPEAIQIADYIRAHSAKDSRIAILGSEPEIFFYANRRSASGHIYMYGLMESQPYALTMQNEFIHDVETSEPDYVVVVTSPDSWARLPSSPAKLFDWWSAYQPQRYKQIVGLADIISPDSTEYRWGDDAGRYRVQSYSAVLIFKRTDPPLSSK